jgi:hypothetical protein
MVNNSNGPQAREGFASEILNESQHQALNILRDRNIGTINIDGAWIWPDDIRTDPSAAVKVIEHFRVMPPPADEELAQIRSDIHIATVSQEPAPLAVSFLPEGMPIGGHPSPRSQLDFIDWVQHNYESVFGTKCYPTGALAIKAPRVPGLRVYACEAFGGYYYAAWTEHDGLFFGHLYVEATHMGRASLKFAVGTVLGTPVFGDMLDYRVRRAPIQQWTRRLKDLAPQEVK